MLNWKDEQIVDEVDFESLRIGTPFEHYDCLYIKTTANEAFDVINGTTGKFQAKTPVIERNATITFH